MADVQVPDDPKWLRSIAEKRQKYAYGLLLGAAALAIFGVYEIVGKDYVDGVFTVVLSLVAAGIGAWRLASVDSDPSDMSPVDKTRLQILVLGGLVGLTIAIFGVVLGWVWWKDILSWMQPGGAELSNTGQSRRTTGLHALLPMPVAVLGLAIMFASLLLARRSERSSAFMRRLLYGYNTALTCLLLLLVLAVANVFAAVKLQKPLDFTTSNMFTLSDQSVSILKNIKEPVKVYSILDGGGPVGVAVQTMLTNCQEVNPNLQVEEVSPNPNVNPAKYRELRQKYPNLQQGLLIQYGPPGKEEFGLVKAEDLFTQEMDRFGQGKPRFEFKGEDAFMTELTFLEGGKQKSVIYFLQGHDELDINDTRPDSENGCGVLKRQLERRNFEVKPLELTALNAKVPDDAKIVVIPGPRSPLPTSAVKALENYMNTPKGRMVVLVGPVLNTDKTAMAPLGLEPLLAKFNVSLGKDRILSVPSDVSNDLTAIVARINPNLSQTALVRPFPRQLFLLQDGTREVKVQSGPPMTQQRTRAEPLLLPRVPVWPETNLTTDPDRLFANYEKNPKLIEPKLSLQLPLAVVVTEMTGPPPNPHMFTPPTANSVAPRLAVFGNAGMASNRRIDERLRRPDFPLLSGTLEWLREKPANIGIPPKKHQVFVLPTGTNYWSFVLSPVVLILFGIVGLGTGVWLVRRR